MVNFSDSPNPLFETVFQLSTRLKGSRLSQEVLEEHASSLQMVSDFFSCNTQQAAVLAVMLKMNTLSDHPSVKSILKHFSLKPSYANAIHEVLALFVGRNWIKPQEDIHMQPFASYRLSQRLVSAFNGMSKENLEEKPVTNTLELAAALQRVLIDRVKAVISFDDYIKSCNRILQKNASVPLAQTILEQLLTETENAYLVFFCVQYFKGEEFLHFRELFEEIKPPHDQKYQLRYVFRTKTGPLFEKGMLCQTEDEDFTGRPMYAVSEKIVQHFNPFAEKTTVKKKNFESDYMRVREYESINECRMIYNDFEAAQIKNLHRLLEAERYESFLQQMKDRKMSGGLTALFYGDSGTGKTETVQQLARSSGRHLLMVDAGAIRSKWVGETEKNLNKVFNEYKKAEEYFKHKPILLFNEADAILSKRGTVKDRGDHYENAIQNLLLQQLEDFDGIFMGTTNLSDNLDAAFQRRILFKVHFKKPVDQVRIALFQNAFPEIAAAEMEQFALTYNMTGSEIMNVKKKLTIEEVLNDGVSVVELLHHLCQEELSMQPGQIRKSIGFKRA